jgi:hypothetical protein
VASGFRKRSCAPRHARKAKPARSSSDERPSVAAAFIRSRSAHKIRRRNADRRVSYRPHRRMRSRAERSALACRRSTAVLAAANQRRRSAPERASWDAACSRRYLKRTCPSPATKSQAGHGAGRAFSQSRPGAAVTSRRPREPHSPRAAGVTGCRPLCRARLVTPVAKTVTNVKDRRNISDYPSYI